MLNPTNRARPVLRCVALSAAVLSAISVFACSVPVFRYALERWPADAYQAIVFQRGTLSEAQQSLVRDLSPDGKAGQLHANVSLRVIDLDQDPPPDVLDFWRQLGADTVPWLVVKYPLAVRVPQTIWSGPLTESTVQRLLDSPARQQIVQRLAQGKSAVWLLLEIGDREKDAAAAQLVESRLAYLATVLQLPQLEPQDVANGLISVPEKDLKLEFSFLRLSRSDPAEQALVKMLLGTEADLAGIQEPMVFPIFGRARALYALVGKGINHETIDEAASFLIGQCSCEVKELNPGVDLLLAADWDSLLKSGASTGNELPSPAVLAESAPVTVTISGGDDREPSSPSSGSDQPVSLPRIPMVIGFAAAGLIVGGILLLRKK